MKKELDLKLPGVTELGKEELREVEGGLPFLFLAVVSAWALVCLLYDKKKRGK